jgi:hypothetical protein
LIHSGGFSLLNTRRATTARRIALLESIESYQAFENAVDFGRSGMNG